MAVYSNIAVARFWSKVEVSGGMDECWPWRGGTRHSKPGSYGVFKLAGAGLMANRVAWEIFNGEALGKRMACHICDNPNCCNPYHIYAGDAASNARDAKERGLLKGQDQRGERNYHARLTADDVTRIRERIAAGETNKRIAEDFPVSHGMISLIRNGKAWASVS